MRSPRLAWQEQRATLERRVCDVIAESDALRAQNVELRGRVGELSARVAELERELGRHSGNSSLPPSRDNADQRVASAKRRSAKQRGPKRRPGKQPGEPGARLDRVEQPDRVVVHVPDCCGSCGAGLAEAPVTKVESRQVFDLPLRRTEVTEHVSQRRRCACGWQTKAAFPPEASAPTAWGAQVRAVAVYLLVRHHVPIARCAEILSDLLGAPVSTGWLASLTGEADEGLEPFMADLADHLASEPVAHVDETGARVAGAKWWFHVFSTAVFTFLGVHQNRGVAATDDFGIAPRFRGTLVHDRWAPYWRYTMARHAICGAHLIRDLAGIAEIGSQAPWACAMSELLVEAKRQCDAAREADRARLPASQRRAIRARYDAIVADAIAANPEPEGTKRTKIERASYNLAVALRDHGSEVLCFTEDLAVPFDNNQAERDLRMAKLVMKISGCFRTPKGAERFATVRSYIETGRKHGHNPLDLLVALFTGTPWMIPPAPA